VILGLRALRYASLTGLLVIIVLSVGGCSSSKHKSSTSSTASNAATRWWSNSAVKVGSTIDAAHPDAAAGSLHPSRSDYCGMLKQTLKAGKSILPSGKANDPKLLTGTKAFVAEIEAVAPAEVSDSWRVLGPVIINLVKGGGTIPTGAGATTAKNLQAAQAINTDAKKNCSLDLSAVVTGR
jgi:hypothetical protein